MKNLNTTFRKTFFLMLTGILLITLTSVTNKKNNITNKTNIISEDFRNPIYQELLDRMNDGECFGLNITDVTIRNNKGYMYSYTSYSAGTVSIGPNTTTNIVSGEISVAFSDRNSFNGKKDIQHVRINSRGDGIVAQITLRSWKNAKINVTNLNITKSKYGYFITGNYTDGRSTKHYTIAIYKASCLI